MVGGRFELATQSDFSDALVAATLATAPSTSAVTEVTLPAPVAARYVRYVAPQDGVLRIAEFEVCQLDGTPVFAPTEVNATAPGQYRGPDVSWQTGAYVTSSSLVYRATSAGGPYEFVGSVDSSVSHFYDRTAMGGVTYYYRIAFANLSGGNVCVGELSEPSAGCFNLQRLEREMSDVTKLREGVRSIPYNADLWKAFDGSTGSYPDTGLANYYLGVDLGDPHHATLFRGAPRGNFTGRFNGSVLYGSNDTNNPCSLTKAVPLTLPVSNSAAGVYSELVVTNDAAYRFFFMHKASGFYGNIAEFQLYGWADDPARGELLLAPAEVTFGVGWYRLDMDWPACANAEKYRIERSVNGGAWQIVADDMTTCHYRDPDVLCDGSNTYSYRITAYRDTEYAVSGVFTTSARASEPPVTIMIVR